MSSATAGEQAASAGIDWGEVRRRVAAAGQALERGRAPSPEARRNILKQRAQALALPPPGPGLAGEAIDLLEFMLAYETYALETSFVREVVHLKDLAPLPGTPPFLAGLINVRGQLLAVVDLKVFFELPARGLTDLHQVIILRRGAMELGILADEVTAVRTLPTREIGPALLTTTGIRAEYLRGVTAEAVAVLEAARILADPRLMVNDR